MTLLHELQQLPVSIFDQNLGNYQAANHLHYT